MSFTSSNPRGLHAMHMNLIKLSKMEKSVKQDVDPQRNDDV